MCVLIDELVARQEVLELALDEIASRLITPAEASELQGRLDELVARTQTLETAVDELIAPTPADPDDDAGDGNNGGET